MDKIIVEVVEGPDSGHQLAVSGPLVIGRGEDADLVLHDPQASRRHARLSPTGDGLMVEDLGSKNGTFVNGQEVPGHAVAMTGDHLLVGVSELALRSEEQSRQTRSVVRPIPPALAAPPQRPDYIPEDVARPAVSPLDPLLDVRTKAKAKMAPFAVLILIVLIVLVFLARSR